MPCWRKNKAKCCLTIITENQVDFDAIAYYMCISYFITILKHG